MCFYTNCHRKKGEIHWSERPDKKKTLYKYTICKNLREFWETLPLIPQSTLTKDKCLFSSEWNNNAVDHGQILQLKPETETKKQNKPFHDDFGLCDSD